MLPTICHFLFDTTISPESSGQNIRNKILIYLHFHLAGSGKIFTDPDPGKKFRIRIQEKVPYPQPVLWSRSRLELDFLAGATAVEKALDLAPGCCCLA